MYIKKKSHNGGKKKKGIPTFFSLPLRVPTKATVLPR